MKRLLASFTIAVGLIWGVSVPAAGLSYIEQFECTREPWGMPIPDTYAALRQLGALKRETVNPGFTPGRDGRVFEYDGLTLWTLDAKAKSGRIMVERVEITSPRWQLSSWANVGDALDSVLQRAGWPAVTKGPKMEFSGDADAVALYVKAGRIARIVYTCNAAQGA